MSNVLKWLLVAVLFASVAAAGVTLGGAFGLWGVIPTVVIGWLVGRYFTPWILWGEAEDV